MKLTTVLFFALNSLMVLSRSVETTNSGGNTENIEANPENHYQIIWQRWPFLL